MYFDRNRICTPYIQELYEDLCTTGLLPGIPVEGDSTKGLQLYLINDPFKTQAIWSTAYLAFDCMDCVVTANEFKHTVQMLSMMPPEAQSEYLERTFKTQLTHRTLDEDLE